MEKKEMSMETRLLLFFVLMGLVLLGTQYFYKPPPQPVKPATQTSQPASTAPAPASPAAGAANAASSAATNPATNPATNAQANAQQPPAELPGKVQADKEQTATIDTSFYKVEFSNRGAVVKSWILKKYKDRDGKPLELVNEHSLQKVPAPFTTMIRNAPVDENELFKMELPPDHLSVNFEYSDGRTVTKKSFQFTDNSYLVEVNSEVSQNGVLTPHTLAWRGGFGDQTVSSPSGDEHAVYYESKLQVKDSKEAKNGPVSSNGQFNFEGVEDKYFAAVFLPSGHSSEVTVFSDNVSTTAGTDDLRAGAAFGGEGLNIGTMFVGPKDTDLLSAVDPKLEHLIDWGWTEVLAKPLFLMLHWTAEHMTHNYGWAIILVTIAINVVLSPLSLQSLKSSRKMQKIQPQIAAINAKYKKVSMRDPRKAEQNQEMMDLYKREGVNPMGGCLPMLIQLPFLFAFYRVLSVSIEMRHASWLWVHDLSQPETLPIRMLPVIMIITQFLAQKMTPTPGVDPSQQKMMMLTPLLFGYIFYFYQSGLVLYYLTSNLVSIGRQMILNRMSEPATPAVVDVKASPPKKKK